MERNNRNLIDINRDRETAQEPEEEPEAENGNEYNLLSLKADLVGKSVIKNYGGTSICFTYFDFKERRSEGGFYDEFYHLQRELQSDFYINFDTINRECSPTLCEKSIFGHYRDLFAFLSYALDLNSKELVLVEVGGGVSPLLYGIKKLNPDSRCICIDSAPQYSKYIKYIKENSGIDMIVGDALELNSLLGAVKADAVISHNFLSSGPFASESGGLIEIDAAKFLKSSLPVLKEKGGYFVHSVSMVDIVKDIVGFSVENKGVVEYVVEFGDFQFLPMAVLGCKIKKV